MIKHWVKTALAFLVVTAILGSIMRWLIINPMPGIIFRYIQHTHSHIAFMGWAFNALFAAIIFSFHKEFAKQYTKIFIYLQLSVLGMLFSFPFQGYGAISIFFSALHIIFAIRFAIRFIKRNPKKYANGDVSYKFLLWGFIYLAISAVGPLSLGIISANGMKGSMWYELAIYFFLHFQYNGWFVFAILALFFNYLERMNVYFPSRTYLMIFFCFAVSCPLTYSLSALWTKPPPWVYLTGQMSAAMQLLGLGLFLSIIYRSWKTLSNSHSHWVNLLWGLALLSFVIKIILQALSSIPNLADLAYENRNIIIAYIHLVFIGFTTLFLMGYFLKAGLIRIGNAVKTGILLLITGFIITEFWLISPWLLSQVAFIVEYFNLLLLILASIMTIGAGLILVGTRSPETTGW